MRHAILISLSLMFFMAVAQAQGQGNVGSAPAQVKVVQQKEGAWQLLVNEKPYFIKGVVFTPVKIGESPNEGTSRNWMDYDDDHDGRNDIAYQTWLDKNKNNQKDQDEPVVGDFQLLKDLGINTIRLYHVASNNPILGGIYKNNSSTTLQFDHPVNKVLLRSLYSDYGIRVIMGNFLGSWTIGSGASWDEGTDYTNAVHRENIIKSVKAMVMDSKDEPYVLMWLLGNENNIADWSRCNAKDNLQTYAQLIGEIAVMVHQLDPNHPVAVSLGDGGMMNQTLLKLLNQYAPGVDIIAYNAYRGMNGFGSLWKEAKRYFDRPVFIAEFGTGAYHSKRGEDENWQDMYIRGCWKDIVQNSAAYVDPLTPGQQPGNSIGGVIFDWLDRWYMDGMPSEHNPGTKQGNSLDGISNEEWFGIMSMGNGTDTLMRQERKICDYLKQTWTQEKPTF